MSGPNRRLHLISSRDNDSKQYDDPSSNDTSGLVLGDIGDSQTVIRHYHRKFSRDSMKDP